jgi:hypothetical protein
MAAIGLPPGGRYGGVGYPMVLTALAGVELLGILTAEATFNRRQGANLFEEFWQRRLYPNSRDRQVMATLVYQMARHGLAHTFMRQEHVFDLLERSAGSTDRGFLIGNPTAGSGFLLR